MIKMTEVQKKLIEQNMGLVYSVANRLGRTSEDDIQNGIIGLCIAAQKYDESKGNFSAIASYEIRGHINSMYNFKTRMASVSLEDHREVVSLYQEVGDEEDSSTYEELVKDERRNTEEEAVVEIMKEEIRKYLTDKEKRVFDIFVTGHYSETEIGKEIGVSVQMIHKYVTKIRKKASDLGIFSESVLAEYKKLK